MEVGAYIYICSVVVVVVVIAVLDKQHCSHIPLTACSFKAWTTSGSSAEVAKMSTYTCRGSKCSSGRWVLVWLAISHSEIYQTYNPHACQQESALSKSTPHKFICICLPIITYNQTYEMRGTGLTCRLLQ